MSHISRYSAFVVIFLAFILLYTRLVNLSWGLPYPMHPDERNIVDSIAKLRCDDIGELLSGAMHNIPIFVRSYLFADAGTDSRNYMKVACFNPNFFAYGQLTIYLGYIVARTTNEMHRFFSGFHDSSFVASQMGFGQITMALRTISATASVLTVLVCTKIFSLLLPRRISKNRKIHSVISCLFLMTFSPILIQFAHFGTTESVLMLLYMLVIYFVLLAQLSAKTLFFFRHILISSLWVGFAIATKVSSVTFVLLPIFAILIRVTTRAIIMAKHNFSVRSESDSQLKFYIIYLSKIVVLGHFSLSLILISIIAITCVSGLVAFVLSPHNIISHPDFLGSISYESSVAIGRYVAFYTRQFLYETPLVFHISKIFPYALGLPVFVLSIVGFLLTSWHRGWNTLRFAIVFYCILTMPFFAKWARFVAPIFPILILFAVSGIFISHKILLKLRIARTWRHIIMTGIVIASALAGIAQLSIYTSTDVRFEVSRWIYANIPSNSKILSETANVVDIPIPNPIDVSPIGQQYSLQYVSFDFYGFDDSDILYADYERYLSEADYIFVPSRRVFYNHTCIDVNSGKKIYRRHSRQKCKMLEAKYPKLTEHYRDLFSGELGFVKVAEFAQMPSIKLFGKNVFYYFDESAEETMTVFDHPVIRIYKRK
jgi:hypothetical protein